jgi:peptide/nickel transport system permease protein
MSVSTSSADDAPSMDRVRLIAAVAVPVAQELAKTVALLLLLVASVWGLLELFRAAPPTAPWHERLWQTFAQAGLDRNGMAIAPRFIPAARRSLAIVACAASLAGALSLGLGYLFAVRPALSVLRPFLGLVSAVPAFMFYFLGVTGDSPWIWPGICLAIGDLNASAMTAHCYNGIRRELGQPYVRTALAQGLSAWSDVWPRAILISLEGVCARIPHLLGGTVALEFAYNIHGVGQMALSAVIASRPDYNVLVWIAGLGIVATRTMSLVHRLSRAALTPERGRATAWSHQGSRAGLAALWSSGSAGDVRTPVADHPADWPTGAPDDVGASAPGRVARWASRLQAYQRFGVPNRLKVLIAVVVLALGGAVAAVTVWGGSHTMLETDAPMLHSSREHPLGTNENGEDVLSAIAIGGRELVVPLLAGVSTAVLLGGFFGMISGLQLGSLADTAIDLYAELWECVPKLILVLAALTFISYTHYSIKLFLVMGLAFAPLIFRAVRDEVGALRTSLFLEAAVTLGVPGRRILWKHVLWNHALPVLCVEGAILVGYLMLYDAILGFCQVRQRGEVFTWGNLLGTGIEDLTKRWEAGLDGNSMIVWGPFAAMLLAIASSAVVGDALKSMERSVRFSQ